MTGSCTARLATLALILLAAGGCQNTPPAELPKHVFLVTIDTLRADHLGCYGYPREVSPFIDRLASEGLLFTHALASSSTTAACHTSLFTALQPPQHQLTINGEEMHESLYTLAEMLAERGYRTAGFSTVGFMKGISKGFQHFDTENKYFPAGHVVGKAMTWLAGLGEPGPLFVWVHLFDVHEWYKPENVAEDTRQRAEGLAPAGDELASYLRDEHGAVSAKFGGDAEMVADVDRYDGQLLAVDAALEQLYDFAGDNGLNEDALWIVTSDHGEGLGSHGVKGHGERIYNEQVRVPLLFHFSDGRYGRREIDRLVRHVDVFPTLADLAGGDVERQVFPIVGHSLRPLLEDREQDFAVRYAFSQRREADERRLRMGWPPGDVFSIQSREYKYIVQSEGEDELYHLTEDPLELDNLIAEPSEVRDRMRDYAWQLKRTMAEQGKSLEQGEINPEYVEQLKALGYL